MFSQSANTARYQRPGGLAVLTDMSQDGQRVRLGRSNAANRYPFLHTWPVSGEKGVKKKKKNLKG